MLPSTGYFKAINCPFYESGTCDRPYCHFKHSKREDVGVTAEPQEPLENRPTDPPQESKAAIARSDSDVLQQLVTEAVKKVLANREVASTDNFSCQNVVSQVVEGLKPTLASASSGKLEIVTSNTIDKRTDASASTNKSVPCVYNPTPIAELKKRHIPIISYMPTRESGVALKRKSSPDGIKPWLGIGCESAESQSTEIKYKPTTIINSEVRDTTQSYIPTCKSDSITSNSYEEGSSNEYLLKLREAYYPKSKKRREEYVPKKVKAPLKTVKSLNDSTLAEFESGLDAVGKVSTDVKHVSNVQSGKELSDSCPDFEPKFSDNDEDDNDSQDNIEEYGRDIKDDDCLNDVQDIDGRSLEADVNDESVNGKDSDEKTRTKRDVSIGKETLQSSQCEVGRALRVNADKATNKNAKEYKSKDKSECKDQRNHDSSYKSYEKRHASKEKSRSTSHGRSKDKSDSRRESKESRGKKHGKNKSRDKEQEKYRDKERSKERNGNRHKSKRDKRDCRESEKDRDYDSEKSSECSKKQERTRKRKDERTRSMLRHKSDENNIIEELYVHMENSQERNSVGRSASSLESVRSNLEEDGDEENDHHHSNAIDNYIDEVVLSASDSDHDVQEECLKIFQEYQAPERSQAAMLSKESLPMRKREQTEDVGRKRVAHQSAATCNTRQTVSNQQSKKSINPQQKMYERWRLMRNAVAEKTVSTSTSVSKDVRRNHVQATGAACNSEFKLNGNGRIRIAHVPYAKSLAIEKKRMTENVGKMIETKETDNYKTAAQTAKSGVRVAHVPQMVPQLIRPEPLQVTTQKFPLNVRQYYVNMMHDVCVQIYTNAEDAAQRAVKEEYACHERCKALAVYKNSCMLAAHRLRKEVDQNPSVESNLATTSGSSTVSHEAVLAGKAKGSWSVLKTKRSVTEFRGAMLYGMLKKWIMTEQQLRDNGFPRSHPDGQKGRAKIYVTNSRNQNVLSKVPNERICSRCSQPYMIDKQGLALRPQNCIYHWGRKFTIRGEGRYSCCQQYGSATGCCDAKAHVWEYIDYENLRGYVKTFPKDAPVEEQGVYALDCEMSYTTQGLELTRITVIDEDCSVVYETLVKPQNPVIDYNTRFSGITEESMEDVTTTLLDVQATLLTMFSEKTILVGHSLESDFKALRLLHNTVVDTSVMFPHKNGYPQKRALKNLCSEYLRKIIQNDVGGHDSKEDAVACMELILWKAKEEAKLQ